MVSCGCSHLYAWHSAVLGTTVGAAYLVIRNVLLRLAVSDHGGHIASSGPSGVLGLAVAPAVLFGQGPDWAIRVGWNLIGGVVLVAWGFALVFIVVFPLNMLQTLRQDDETQSHDGTRAIHSHANKFCILKDVSLSRLG